MSGFICCLWWFLAGVLLGWLLNWLFDKFFRRGGSRSDGHGNDASASDAAKRTATVAPQSMAPSVAVPASSLSAASGSTLNVAALASAAAAFGFGKLKTNAGYDNFEIIEGIGPKINDVMHVAGVHTFAALAALDIPAIAKILDAAGPNFKLANPETWAQQASLCASGHWEKLKAWQDELVAGVSIKKDNA